jgi:hypothetical protein
MNGEHQRGAFGGEDGRYPGRGVGCSVPALVVITVVRRTLPPRPCLRAQGPFNAQQSCSDNQALRRVCGGLVIGWTGVSAQGTVLAPEDQPELNDRWLDPAEFCGGIGHGQ